MWEPVFGFGQGANHTKHLDGPCKSSVLLPPRILTVANRTHGFNMWSDIGIESLNLPRVSEELLLMVHHKTEAGKHGRCRDADVCISQALAVRLRGTKELPPMHGENGRDRG